MKQKLIDRQICPLKHRFLEIWKCAICINICHLCFRITQCFLNRAFLSFEQGDPKQFPLLFFQGWVERRSCTEKMDKNYQPNRLGGVKRCSQAGDKQKINALIGTPWKMIVLIFVVVEFAIQMLLNLLNYSLFWLVTKWQKYKVIFNEVSHTNILSFSSPILWQDYF